MKNILVTGGAGYKGVLLVDALLKLGHKVTILDNFMYGFDPVLGLSTHPNCRIIKKDIRNLVKEDVKNYELIYHLAAISGYPACEANPHSAQTINVDSTQLLVDLLEKDQTLIYASTTSLYGKAGNNVDETSEIIPVSTYGATKFKAEQICMKRKNSISLRFATLFGVSQKMRCDLLLNDFVYRAVKERSIILYDSGSVRTFLHVQDAINTYLIALNQTNKMAGGVFNVGSNDMNYSKRQLAERIKSRLPNIEIIETALNDPDQRNFVINFDKINAFGFKPTISLDQGIDELIKMYAWYQPYSIFKTI